MSSRLDEFLSHASKPHTITARFAVQSKNTGACGRRTAQSDIPCS
jgi:hypothetical protein